MRVVWEVITCPVVTVHRLQELFPVIPITQAFIEDNLVPCGRAGNISLRSLRSSSGKKGLVPLACQTCEGLVISDDEIIRRIQTLALA